MKDSTSSIKHVGLLVVDMQYDFLPPHGALAVGQADAIVAGICRCIAQYDFVYTTQDFHPPQHKSFASAHNKKVNETIMLGGKVQNMWPDHCVQGTRGVDIEASIMDALTAHPHASIVRKGTNRDIDSYSGFFDNDGNTQTELHQLLQRDAIRELHVCGVATDYCVKYTVLDALRLGYTITLFRSLCKAVELQPGDEEKAITDMRNAGAVIA